MSKRENTNKPVAPGTAGPPVAPETLLRAAEGEEWPWMVDEDPAFYLREARPAPEKRGG